MTNNSDDTKKTKKSASKKTDTSNEESLKRRSGQDRRQDKETAANYPADKDRRKGPRRYDDRRIEEVTKTFMDEMSDNKESIRRAERHAFTKAVVTSVLLCVIIVGLSMIFLGPTFFADLEKEKVAQIEAIEEKQEQLREKQQQLLEAQRRMRAEMQQFAGGNLIDKISQIQDLSGQMKTMNNRIAMLQSSNMGQKILNDGTKDLQKMLTGMQGRVDNIETELQQAKKDNDALADILEGMNGNDLKAAAMMLAVTQLRETIMSGGSPEEDIETVRMLAGDDKELLAAIEKIEPYAKNGIMSREKLSSEFTDLAGEIAKAELAGEDISWKEKALNRLNNIVTVKKKGMAEGDDRAAITARAETLMNQGDIKGAIAELEKLDPAAKQKAQPWIEDAQARVAAEELSSMLSNDFVQQLENMTSRGAGRAVQFGTGGGSGSVGGGPVQFGTQNDGFGSGGF